MDDSLTDERGERQTESPVAGGAGMILHALHPGALLDARPGGHLPEPRLLRRLPAPGPRGAGAPARAPRAAAGAFLRTRLGAAARRRQERARRLPRRRPGGPRLRP